MTHHRRHVELEDIWPKLEADIQQLITGIKEGLTIPRWWESYDAVYTYCTNCKNPTDKTRTRPAGAFFGGEFLYNKLKEFLEERMSTLLLESKDLIGEPLLIYYKTQWDLYTSGMAKVNHLFAYLNRHWIKREMDDGRKEVYEVYPLSLVIWRDKLFNELRTRLTNATLAMIERERHGEDIDASLTKGVIGAYVSLGLTRDKPNEIYREYFEREFLQQTEYFYTQESSEYIMQNSVADYMKKVEIRLVEENRRIERYLHASTSKDLINRCEVVLIEKHMDQMWAEASQLLIDEKVEGKCDFILSFTSSYYFALISNWTIYFFHQSKLH